jgi:hypothetical protein
MCKPDNPLNLSAPPTRVHWVYDDPGDRTDVRPDVRVRNGGVDESSHFRVKGHLSRGSVRG